MVLVPLAFFSLWPSSQMMMSSLGVRFRFAACFRNIFKRKRKSIRKRKRRRRIRKRNRRRRIRKRIRGMVIKSRR